MNNAACWPKYSLVSVVLAYYVLTSGCHCPLLILDIVYFERLDSARSRLTWELCSTFSFPSLANIRTYLIIGNGWCYILYIRRNVKIKPKIVHTKTVL